MKRRSFGALRAASSSTNVPKTSVWMNSPADCSDRSTCVSAAKCTTRSDCWTRGAATLASAMSPRTNVWRGWPSTSFRFSSRPAYVSLSSVVMRQSSCAWMAQRTKLLPMNPAPPVTRTSTIFAGPVVVERAVRLEAMFVGLGPVVRLVGHVDNERGRQADALPAVVDAVRHPHEHRPLPADEELVDDALGGRSLARVDQHQLDHAAHAREMVDLLLVVVPRFDHAGIGGRDVDLAELRELRIVDPKNLHQPSPLVGDEP